MTEHIEPEQLLEFPCSYEFKAFGDTGMAFPDAVLAVVSEVLPISRDAMKVRSSSGGKYQCVSILVHLQSAEQLRGIYAALRQSPNIRYLL